jgi:hypothetical protein
MFPLLDIPVETTVCGMQTEWDDGDNNVRCNSDGQYHSDNDSDGVDDFFDQY